MTLAIHRSTFEVIVGDDVAGKVRAEPDGGPWVLDPDASAVLDVDGVPLVPVSDWKWSGDAVVELSQADKDARTAADFDAYKLRAQDRVDARSGQLIGVGLEWPPASGKRLSMSAIAQFNLEVMDRVRDDPAFAYPVAINYGDNSGAYSCPDAAALHGIFLTALGFKRGVLDAGTALKTTIRAAATEAEVDAVGDPR